MGNKAVGITLALISGLFIGVSFVFKKRGLLDATAKNNAVAGEGYGYLKNWTWWLGMTLMMVGEVCNFVAYAFTEALLVTPLGALAVVTAAIGSSIFLKERLSFVGKVGCSLCILGAVVIVLNAPAQPSVSTIQEMKHYAISVVFLPYCGVILLIAAFLAFWAGPRYGQTNIWIYISICSIVGGISVVCTQGFGASVVSAISGKPDQWNNWFLWVLFIFVVCTLLVELIFLNKALNIFNTSVVTPIYFTYFTTMTMLSSAVLFRGFNGTPTSIITVVLGFFTIVAGVVLLQVSLAAQDKPDSQVLSAELNDVSEVLHRTVDDDGLNPGPASIRGALSIRRFQTRNVSSAQQVENLRRRQTQSSASRRQLGSRNQQLSDVPLQAELPFNYRSQGLFNTTHENSIRFETGSSSTELENKSRLNYDPSKLPFHVKSEYIPRIYASEMQHKSALDSDDGNSNIRMAPLPQKDKSTFVPRVIKKQFSFASRGRMTEEEKVGLTSTSDSEIVAVSKYSSESASESSENQSSYRMK